MVFFAEQRALTVIVLSEYRNFELMDSGPPIGRRSRIVERKANPSDDGKKNGGEQIKNQRTSSKRAKKEQKGAGHTKESKKMKQVPSPDGEKSGVAGSCAGVLGGALPKCICGQRKSSFPAKVVPGRKTSTRLSSEPRRKENF